MYTKNENHIPFSSLPDPDLSPKRKRNAHVQQTRLKGSKPHTSSLEQGSVSRLSPCPMPAAPSSLCPATRKMASSLTPAAGRGWWICQPLIRRPWQPARLRARDAPLFPRVVSLSRQNWNTRVKLISTLKSSTRILPNERKATVELIKHKDWGENKQQY